MRTATRSTMASSIDLQELGATLVIYNDRDDAHKGSFNPSIAFRGNDLKIAIRSCNFAVRRHGHWYLRDGSAFPKTDVLYGDLDPATLQVTNTTKLKLDDNSPVRTRVSGLEDVRIFSRKDGMHAIGFESDRVTSSLHNSSASLAEYLIKGDELKYIRTLTKPRREAIEKNWQPTDKASKLFDFTYSPTQVWKDEVVTGNPYKGQIHGGTQLLKQEDGTYLSLVHEKRLDWQYGRVYDKFVYITYLARHNENGIITHLSKPFNFGTHENIEFASGMVEHNSHLLIAVGIGDVKFAIVKVEKELLVSMLVQASM